MTVSDILPFERFEPMLKGLLNTPSLTQAEITGLT